MYMGRLQGFDLHDCGGGPWVRPARRAGWKLHPQVGLLVLQRSRSPTLRAFHLLALAHPEYLHISLKGNWLWILITKYLLSSTSTSVWLNSNCSLAKPTHKTGYHTLIMGWIFFRTVKSALKYFLWKSTSYSSTPFRILYLLYQFNILMYHFDAQHRRIGPTNEPLICSFLNPLPHPEFVP